jgi:hypothetical protein
LFYSNIQQLQRSTFCSVVSSNCTGFKSSGKPRLTKWCFIISIRSKEGLFYRLQFIVGQIFSIYAIDDHKQLYVLKQAVIAPERMVLAAIDLVEGF